MALSTTEKLNRLGGVFGTAMVRFVRTIVGIPVAVGALAAGGLVFSLGAVITPRRQGPWFERPYERP